MAGLLIRACMSAAPPKLSRGRSHSPASVRHSSDGTRRENVTDGRQRLSGRRVRGQPAAPPGRGVPDARLAERGGRRGAGGVDPSQPHRHRERREPRRLADHRHRARVSRHAPVAHVATRGSVRRERARADRGQGVDPEYEAAMADSVGLAMLVVLETLPPAERLAFVLHDMFAVPFDEIAPIVGRSSTAARQLASRARRRVQGPVAVPEVDRDPSSARSSARSSPRRVTATSTAWSRCWTRTRRCTSTRTPGGRGPEQEIHGAELIATGAKTYGHRARFGRLALVDGAVGIVLAPRGQAPAGADVRDRERRDRRDRHRRRPGPPREPRDRGPRPA